MPPFDRLTEGWASRYGLAVVVVGLQVTVNLLFGRIMGQFYLVPFVAVLVASVVGGLGPGLLATILTAIVGYEVPINRLNANELLRLTIDGTLVAIVGGTLRAARLKSRERLETSFKLEQQILEISDQERRRIGYDLHDGLGQHLTGISMLSETVAQQLKTGEKPDPANVETITRLVSEAVSITRDLAKSLSSITLERDGLVAALVELADSSSSLFGICCSFDCDCDPPDLVLDPTCSLHLFRIVQEAVHNSVRHGKAKNVDISLTRDRKNLALTVVDDGIGLSEKTSANQGLGLRIMAYRATILRGSLTARRVAPRGGTVVTCVWPLDSQTPRRKRERDSAV